MQIFVSATDTDVGKTVITAGLAALMQSLGYKAGVYKPFQSGAEDRNGFLVAPDLAYVKKIDAFVETAATYLLKAPVAPSLAAEIEKVKIDTGVVLRDFETIKAKCDTLIVEGAGGIATPVSQTLLMSDIVKLLDLPLVIVARPDLGTVNHTILTVNFAYAKGLNVRGVLINRYPQGTDDLAVRTAPRLIEEYSDTQVLGIVRDIEPAKVCAPGVLIDTILNSVDVEKIFGVKIPKLELE